MLKASVPENLKRRLDPWRSFVGIFPTGSSSASADCQGKHRDSLFWDPELTPTNAQENASQSGMLQNKTPLICLFKDMGAIDSRQIEICH